MGSARRPEFSLVAVTQARSAKRYGLSATAATAPGGSPNVWLDGTDVNLTSNSGISDGDPLTTWKNKGSGGATYDVTQATGANKPVVRLSRINSKACVVYDTTDYLRCATGNPNAASAARHMFFVATLPASGARYLWLSNEAIGYTLPFSNSSVKFEDTFNGNSAKIAAMPATGTNMIVEITFDGTTTHLPTCRINGVDQVVTQNAGTGVGAETDTGSYYAGYQFNEAIGEIINYVGIQTAGVVADTRSYLAAKWGLSA